jgi:plasmid rolling circle replication initiator protein Rep
MKNISTETDQVNTRCHFDVTFSAEELTAAYAPKKRGALAMARTYRQAEGLPREYREKVALEMERCGRTLVFAEDLEDPGEYQFLTALFCQKRLCPMCSWRRSLKVFANIKTVIAQPEFRGLEYVFITLTSRNCSADELPGWLDRYLAAWNVLVKDALQPFRKSFRGTFRGIEITYDPAAGTYHPHMHVLAAAGPEYFAPPVESVVKAKPGKYQKKPKKPLYISHDRLKTLWTDALNRARNRAGRQWPVVDFDPWVHIEKVDDNSKAVAEVAKYEVKDGAVVGLPDVVAVLDRVLRGRRLIAYGDLFWRVRKRLRLEDEEADGDIPRQEVADILRNPLVRKIVFEWNLGNGLYQVKEVVWPGPGRVARNLAGQA